MNQFNNKTKFNFTSIIIKYRILSNYKLNLILTNIKVYENDKYIGSINLNNFINTIHVTKKIELLKTRLKRMSKL